MARKKRNKSAEQPTEGTLTRPQDVESTPQGVVKRWCAELDLASDVEKDWRKEADEIWKIYEAESKRAASFNILWSNTEILAASIYNSTPQPDVRRRFRDEDKVGKAVSTVLERSLSYEIDDYDFDAEIDLAVLDLLLAGRAVVRIKYEPKFEQIQLQRKQQAAADVAQATDSEPNDEDSQASLAQESPDVSTPADALASPVSEQETPATYERIADQRVECAHVQWNDFRHGPGKTWREVPWIAFRHEFTYDMAIEMFGRDVAAELKFEQCEGATNVTADREVRSIFKVCEVWEIWDKETRRVLFIAPTYRKQPCLVVDDPLQLKGFWPLPRPAYAIRNSRSLVPIPIYRLYEEQAKELDQISGRITITVRALRLRGAYNAALKELGAVIQADDVDMIAIENAAAVAESGGLERNLWLMPIDKLIQVLRGLYDARDQIKQTIYEIVGIADILRGASDPNETLGAQKIKSTWGSIRVQKLQREIQRMVRDLMRLKAEVIAEQFTPRQLAAITNVQLPTQAQQEQARQIAARAQQEQQPIPEDAQRALSEPSWEAVMQVMRSDALRSYRVDVETDSTIAETITRDMQGMSELVQSVGAILNSVKSGVPIDTAKQVALAMIRRARLGSAVEDAIEAIPQQEDEMRQFAQQIMQLIQQEGQKQAQAQLQMQQQQAGLAQYDGEIRQLLGVLGQAAQGGAVQAQTNQQVLGELANVVQQLNAAGQGMAAAVQTMMQALSTVTSGLQEIKAAVEAPKQITFQRDRNNRIAGATAARA